MDNDRDLIIRIIPEVKIHAWFDKGEIHILLSNEEVMDYFTSKPFSIVEVLQEGLEDKLDVDGEVEALDSKKLLKMENVDIGKLQKDIRDRIYRKQFIEVEEDKFLTSFKKGQVWENPDGLIMLVTSVKLELNNEDIDKAKEGKLKISYIAEDGQKGFFYIDDKEIVDNIKKVEA